MKHLLTIFFVLNFIFSSAQDYPFAKEFKKGNVTFKDSSVVEGELKWFPHQNSDLKFRKSEKDKTIKYEPKEIAGFYSENLKFASLSSFTAYADYYTMFGRRTEVKQAFGQVISEGKFNIYLVTIVGINAIANGVENYTNFIFQDTNSINKELIAYPYLIRMKEKKYENAKEQLLVLFKDYPAILEKIKNFKKEDNFLEIIEMVENIK